MTVIALFEEARVGISDVLLSRSKSLEVARTPTGGTAEDFARYGLEVSRLVRKVVSAEGPSGKAEFLVAGTVRHIEFFTAALRIAFKSPRDLPEQLQRKALLGGPFGCFEAAALLCDALGFSQFEAAGVAGDRLAHHTFDAVRMYENIPYFGQVLIAGSGARDLLDWLRIRGESMLLKHGDGNEDDRRFHITHMVPLLLMAEDLGDQRTLQAGVGGYYESFVLQPGGLSPVDDCLTLFVDIIGRRRDAAVEVRQLLYHCYRGDMLNVLSLPAPVYLTAGTDTRVALADCCYDEIPPLSGSRAAPSWTPHVLAAKMRGARNIRLHVRKEVGGVWASRRRMTHGAGPQLVEASVAGEYLRLSLDIDAFHKDFDKFYTSTDDPIWV